MILVRTFTIFFIAFFLSSLFIPIAHADRAEELRTQIANTASQLKSIEAEIAAFQKQLDTIAGQKNTLQSTISALDINRKKLSADISATEAKIRSANLIIEQLGDDIGDIQSRINSEKHVIEKSIRDIYYRSDQSFIESILSQETLGEGMERTDELLTFQNSLKKNIVSLTTNQQTLSTNKKGVEEKRQDLTSLKTDLASQKNSLDIARAEQQKLLTQTKNQESTYQKLVAEKKAAHEKFESDIATLEEALTTIIDPSKIPKVGSGVLRWPFSSAFIASCKGKQSFLKNIFCVTQYFGNTSFATNNPQIYKGAGHNGIDIAAPIGTPLHSALTGVVKGTGNTDLYKGCYSYGMWIMVEHPNGLTTVYGHLSRISVSVGQKVSTGEVIGYTGMTGYSTGPHLHFTLLASEGAQIIRVGSRTPGTPCANASIPISPVLGYLNPMSYL